MVANITKALRGRRPPGQPRPTGPISGPTTPSSTRSTRRSQRSSSGLANKKLVTNHDAFGYYVDRYGLEFVGSVIPSFDTQAELSSGDISDLVAKIEREGVKAVFSEASLPPKTAEAIAARRA